MQGGTHEEAPRPAISVVDGATLSLTEGRMGMGMFEGELVEVKVLALELVFSEAQLPGDVRRADREGVVMFDDERHGEMVK